MCKVRLAPPRCKNDDFQLRNASDNVKGTIRTGSSKIYDFERKMLRIAENRRKSMLYFANRLLERVRTCFEIIIFVKNVDGDPRKIAEISRKIRQHEALREKQRFSGSERFRLRIRGN